MTRRTKQIMYIANVQLVYAQARPNNKMQKKIFQAFLLILQRLGCPHPGYSQGGTWTAPKPYMSKSLVKIFFPKENPSLQPPGIEPATSQVSPIKYLPNLDWFYNDKNIRSIYTQLGVGEKIFDHRRIQTRDFLILKQLSSLVPRPHPL